MVLHLWVLRVNAVTCADFNVVSINEVPVHAVYMALWDRSMHFGDTKSQTHVGVSITMQCMSMRSTTYTQNTPAQPLDTSGS